MRAQPVDLIGGFYKDDALPWSCQDTVNWLPVMTEVGGTRTVSKFSTAPGLKPYQQIGTGPIRGMHDCEGLRLIVSGRYLFRISNTGVGIPIGLIPGVGRVQMTHNQFKTGYQVLIENGQGGGGYVYTTSTDTFAKITDEGYPGSISSDYLDSYILGVEPQGRFWFHSNLADATDYNTFDRYEAEAAPDKIVGLAVSQFEVVVFGQRTIEFFFNAGGQTGTFQNRRQSITRGCASRHTIQKLDNTLFWLGDDGVVYRMEGYAPRPISTRALEKAITGFNWSEAIAFTWEDRGHKVYYLTLPDGQTFGYDVITGVWHRRESYGLSRWRLSHTQKWGRDWFGGDFQNGRIWEIDWDYFLEGDQPIISERTSGVVADNQSALVIPNAELVFDTGKGPATSAIEFPVQPPMPQLSGDAPDGFIGGAYSFTYTRTSGTAPFTFSISSGALPPGINLAAATGVLSGNPSVVGSSAFTVRVTDANGLWAEVSDTVAIGAAFWLLRANVPDARVWASFDAITWQGPYNRAPIVTTPGSASRQLGAGGAVIVIGSTTTAERSTDFDVADGVTNTSVTVPANIGRIRTFGATTLAFVNADGAPANTYYAVEDGGQTWTARTLSSSLQIRDVARLASGRWYSYQQVGPSYGMYYSDEESPSTWISTGYGIPQAGERCIITSGTVILSFGTLNQVMRFKNGSWATLSPGGAAFPDARCGLYMDGRWFMAGQPQSGTNNLVYSDDDGGTWTRITVPGLDGIYEIYAANGRLVVSGVAPTSGTLAGVASSSDRGATWTPSTMPYPVGSGAQSIAFPVVTNG
ncbi:TPA: putative Ig domain-containing protein [Stenotrophomonas maltophilia]